MSWGIDVVVPISGGKDSQACLQLAVENRPPASVFGLFCDTGFEHPLTYEHVDRMRAMYGVEILRVQAGTVEEQVLKHNRFPSFAARFCTEELKIWPTKRFCETLAREQGHGFEVWYGMRSGESSAREKRYAGKVGEDLYPPHEVLAKYPKKLAKLGVMFRLAVLEWTDQDVFDYVGRSNVNPLYLELGANGEPLFDRVGCFPCWAAGDQAKEKAFAFDATGRKHKVIGLRLETQTGKSMWTSKGGLARNSGPGCAVCQM